MAIPTRSPFDATHRAEVVFTRDLSARYGIAEVETDYEVVLFIGQPTDCQLLTFVPDGWDFLESHTVKTADLDLDDDLDIAWEAADYFDDDSESELEELKLEVV